jgi:REP element-mobilizing transposase RayT
VTQDRQPLFGNDANIELLRATVRRAKEYRPFAMHAYALLPDHFDYIHYNPVKHGYVSIPEAYAYTSFHEYVKRGWYQPGWGHTQPRAISALDFE